MPYSHDTKARIYLEEYGSSQDLGDRVTKCVSAQAFWSYAPTGRSCADWWFHTSLINGWREGFDYKTFTTSRSKYQVFQDRWVAVESMLADDAWDAAAGYAGWVYVVQCGPWCKIGQTTNLHKRLPALTNLHPDCRLIYWCACAEAPVKLEKRLHRLLATKRVKGEWFALTADDFIRLAAEVQAYRESKVIHGRW